jgi:methionyl-tRNA formyltransferase
VIIFAGYRPWAIKAYEHIEPISTNYVMLVDNPKQLNELLESGQKFAGVFLAGWSWILSRNAVRNHVVVGVHPSDLPEYAGGTPIQHQILDGLTESKVTLFRLTDNVDEGPYVYKERFDMTGSLERVFTHLSVATARLFIRYESALPDLVFYDQAPSRGPQKVRLKPEDGRVHLKLPEGMMARDLYNFIRCREEVGGHNVYPHSYYEDETGRVLFSSAKFQEPEASAPTLRST